MNPPQQVMSVIYLVSHIEAHLQEQTAQNVNQSFLTKYIWSRPPLSPEHGSFCCIYNKALSFFFFFFFNLNALFHLKLIKRSPSQQVVRWPPDEGVWCWCRTDVMWTICGGIDQSTAVQYACMCVYMCVHVCLCVHRCMYIITGVMDRPLGNKTISWMQRPLG